MCQAVKFTGSSAAVGVCFAVPTNDLSPNGSTNTFGIAISLVGTSGGFIDRTDTLLTPPNTQVEQTYVIDNLALFDPSQLAILFGCYSYAAQTSGQCICNIYAINIAGLG